MCCPHLPVSDDIEMLKRTQVDMLGEDDTALRGDHGLLEP